MSVKPCTSQTQLPLTEEGLCYILRQILICSEPGETRVPSWPCSICLAGFSTWTRDLHGANMGCGVKRMAAPVPSCLHPLCEWETTLRCRYSLSLDGRGETKVSIVTQGWIYQQLRGGEIPNVARHLLIYLDPKCLSKPHPKSLFFSL